MNTTPWLPFGTESSEPTMGSLAMVRQQLFERRIVLLSGVLDDQTATSVGAGLMTLDATGDDPVQLQIDSGDGSVGAALALMDIIDLLGVPVLTWCKGQAVGPALGVLAVGTHRMVSPHAQLRLFEPSLSVRGNARQIEQLATAHLDQWSNYCSRLSSATGQPVDCVRDDAARGRYLSGPEAVDYGLADEVATPTARVYHLPSRPIGFGKR